MSTSSSVPVLRTVDLSAAYRAAVRLLDLVEPLEKFHVNAEAQVRTLEEAQRLVAALPNAVISPNDPRRSETSDEIKL